jgi:site-specific DNA recombinase
MSSHPLSPALRVGTYFRNSDDGQENSIERQRSQVDPYVTRRKYVKIGEYVDEDIAGDEFEKRRGLQKLLRDVNDGLIDVIVCDEPQRFSRQDPVEFIARVAHPLRAAGVNLDTVSDGLQGWDDVVSIITLTIKQDRSSGESKTLSRRVLTGCANLARAGQHLGGPAPYGYQVRYSTGEGKPRPLGLEVESVQAKVVRWMFAHYLLGWTLERIAIELNTRCVPPPARRNRRRGRVATPPVWTTQAVRCVLKNAKYTGDAVWNQQSNGKYHRFAGGRAEVKQRKQKRFGANPVEEWIVKADQHEALVTREDFDRVQEMRQGNRAGCRGQARKGYVLSGMLKCGFCGRKLRGRTRYGKEWYTCQPKDDAGRKVCGTPQVEQAVILDAMLKALQRKLLGREELKKLREQVREDEEAAKAPERLGAMQRELDELQAKIDRGIANLALLPPELVPDVSREVGKFRQQHDALSRERERAKVDSKTVDLERVIVEAERALWEIREAMQARNPERLRRALEQFIAYAVVRWETLNAGGRSRYLFLGGAIWLRSEQRPADKYGEPHLPSGRCPELGFTATGTLVA